MLPHLALAIDLGGTKVASALVDSTGQVLTGSRFRHPTGASSSSEQLADNVRDLIAETLAAAPHGATILGAGIGTAGPIEQDQGRVSPLNLPAWQSFLLRDLVAQCIPDLPVTMRVDGLCITLAEHWVGAGKGFNNVMGMIVSTGVGGGLILGGRTVAGGTGNAGHIGHVEVAGYTTPCACGGTGCLESIASGPRSVAWAREQGWDGTTGEELSASYEAGNDIARAAIERAGVAIGRAIGSATALLDLDIAVIGGGFSNATPDIFDHIRNGVTESSSLEFVHRVRVVPSSLSDEGPLIGAAALVHHADMLN